MIKIKFCIWELNQEIVNTYARVERLSDNRYSIYFEDGISYDLNCTLDLNTRTFHSV
jgi:hypothetical protein